AAAFPAHGARFDAPAGRRRVGATRLALPRGLDRGLSGRRGFEPMLEQVPYRAVPGPGVAGLLDERCELPYGVAARAMEGLVDADALVSRRGATGVWPPRLSGQGWGSMRRPRPASTS